MPLQAKVLSSARSIKSLVSPVISVTIHSDIQRALGFWRHKTFDRSAAEKRSVIEQDTLSLKKYR